MASKEKILSMLQNNNETYVSGSYLAEQLGISRNAVWKNINSLKNDGFNIVAVSNKGYKLLDAFSKISQDNISSLLTTSVLGRNIMIFQEIDSTNNYAKNIAKNNNAPDGCVIISECQTSGKGRLGRAFQSPKGTGIYMSIILKRDIPMDCASLLTSCTAVAVADSVDNLYHTDSKIKWVNDLFLNGKKFCGILTEASIGFEAGSLEFAVIGIGINVKSIKSFADADLLKIATSLEDETNLDISRNILIAEILNNLEPFLNSLPDKLFMNQYRKKSFLIGHKVRVTYNGFEHEAFVLDIDDNAGLVVRMDDGNTRILNSGEARVII